MAVVALLGAMLGFGSPARAQSVSVPTDSWAATGADKLNEFDRDVFFFAGAFHTNYFGDSFTPWSAEWEHNYVIGGGYQQFFWRWGFVRFGGEVGIADRFVTDGNTSFGASLNSGELWAGAVARFDGFDFGPVHITPAITAGLSAVTGLIGQEAMRESTHPFDRFGLGGKLLYYLGPELDFSMPQYNPDLEVFVRLQHRSGGFGSIEDLDGSNADVVGVRWKF